MSKEQKDKISKALKGKKRPNYAKYKSVVGTTSNGLKFYTNSIKNAAFILGIDKSCISHCLDGSRKNTCGFTWEYCSPETIQSWSRGELITSRSAMHPIQDEDIVHTIAKNRSYGVCDKGLISLARRSNTIKTIAAEPIYENDIVDIELGMNRHLSHKIDITKERGEIIAYYCLVELTNGGVQFEIMTKKDVENHRAKFSKSYKKDDPNNIWNKNFDAMALKTLVIKTLKLCPISIEALEAISKEEMEEVKIADEGDYTIQDEPVAAIENNTVQQIENNSVPMNQQMPENGFSAQENAMLNAAFDSLPPNQQENGDIF